MCPWGTSITRRYSITYNHCGLAIDYSYPNSPFRLKAYIDKDKLDEAAKNKELAVQEETAAENKKEEESNIKKGKDNPSTTKGDDPNGNPTDTKESIESKDSKDSKDSKESKGSKVSKDSGVSLTDNRKLENGGQTVVAEINHVTETSEEHDPSRKTSVLKQEDIKISAKQTDSITPVESVK